MNFDDFPGFAFERRGRVLTVSIDNESQRNAITDEMDALMPRLWFELDADEESSVIVLTGKGKAFSAGGNVAGMSEATSEESLTNFLRGYRNGKRFMQTMLDSEKIIIAKVNGDAVGLGCTLALFCDIVVASETARFADPHVRVGLVAGDGAAAIWPLNIGYAAAKYYMLTGELLPATEAQRLGLIAKAVPAEELDSTVDQLADRLANGASNAIKYSKAVANIALRQQFASVVDAGFALETISAQLPEHREATKAFVEKRKPNFHG